MAEQTAVNRSIVVRIHGLEPCRHRLRWLGCRPLKAVERGRPPLAAPIASVAQQDRALGYEPRGRRIEACRMLQFNRVKLVPEEPRAWNAEDGGRNTAP